MKTKHTPGPWMYDVNQSNGALFLIHNGPDAICSDVSDWSDYYDADRAESNAKLIASAPELLEALTKIAERTHTQSNIHKIAKEAIKKATS
jgi:hypothetical protein